jgi:hypothetical protein
MSSVFAYEACTPHRLALSKGQVDALSQARIFCLELPYGNSPFAGCREDLLLTARLQSSCAYPLSGFAAVLVLAVATAAWYVRRILRPFFLQQSLYD